MNVAHHRTAFPLLTLSCLLVLSRICNATEDRPANKASPSFAETVAKTTSDTEEVIVSGRLDSLSAVRKAVDAAEDRFLNRYNELNDDWRFDVKCIVGPTTGHHIWVRHCEAGYVAEAKRDAAVHGVLHYGNLNDSVARDSMFALARLPELQARIRAVVASDTELQRALVERALLVERYGKLHKNKHEGNWIVWD